MTEMEMPMMRQRDPAARTSQKDQPNSKVKTMSSRWIRRGL